MSNKLKRRARALAAERGISYQAAINLLRAERQGIASAASAAQPPPEEVK